MKLKELRKKQDISQADVSKVLGISQNTYSTYEVGRAEPSIENLCKLADLFNVSIDELVERKTEDELVDVSKLSAQKKAMIFKVLQMPDKMAEALNVFLRDMSDI